jgi:DNA modification methylase
VWSKPNGLPESVVDRVRRSHEQWFHLTKEPSYFAGIDEIREAYAPGSIERIAQGFENNTRAETGNHANGMMRSMAEGQTTYEPNTLGKLPGSVWTVATEPLKIPAHLDVDHFAAFPQEWPRRLILGWSPMGYCVECDQPRRPITSAEKVKPPAHGDGSGTGSGRTGDPNGHRATDERFDKVISIEGYGCACDKPTAPIRPAVVLDPFGGTGTVAMVARALGRYGISLDLSTDYLRLAKWRIWESGHASKALQRTHREAQGSMFGGAA